MASEPPKRPQFDGPTVVPDDEPSAGSSRLLIIGPNSESSFTLPGSGEVLIGRGSEVDIAIDDASISRKHAVIRVTDPLEIKDLGSQIGTSVRDSRLESRHGPTNVFGERQVQSILAARAKMLSSQQGGGPPIELIIERIVSATARCSSGTLGS